MAAVPPQAMPMIAPLLRLLDDVFVAPHEMKEETGRRMPDPNGEGKQVDMVVVFTIPKQSVHASWQ